MQKSISRSSNNFWYRLIAVFLRDNQTTGKQKKNNNLRSEIKGSKATIANVSVLTTQLKLQVFLCIYLKYKEFV